MLIQIYYSTNSGLESLHVAIWSPRFGASKQERGLAGEARLGHKSIDMVAYTVRGVLLVQETTCGDPFVQGGYL